jgi:hypothetical protein
MENYESDVNAKFTIDSELTAGQMLRLARTTGRRKRELNTLARLLCIKEDFLEALENDDFGRIPEMVYILGFARNYAMELELDPYVIVEKIKKQMGFLEEEDMVDPEAENMLPPEEKIDAEPATAGGANVFLRRNGKNILIVFGALVLIALLGLAVGTLIPDTPRTEEPAELVGTKYNLPTGKEFGIKNRDYAAIVLQATGAVWVQIKNQAGTVVFEHSMMAGDVYYALNGSLATIGNAGAMDIWVNGREIPKLGAEHQRLLDVPLTPDSLIKS